MAHTCYSVCITTHDGIVRMPTVLRSGPYRFFFYAGDGGEPLHIHVEHDTLEAKYWLDPVRLERNNGFSSKELGRIETIVEENAGLIKERWDEFFSH